MSRRGFLKMLAGFLGVSIMPRIGDELKTTLPVGISDALRLKLNQIEANVDMMKGRFDSLGNPMWTEHDGARIRTTSSQSIPTGAQTAINFGEIMGGTVVSWSSNASSVVDMNILPTHDVVYVSGQVQWGPSSLGGYRAVVLEDNIGGGITLATLPALQSSGTGLTMPYGVPWRPLTGRKSFHIELLQNSGGAQWAQLVDLCVTRVWPGAPYTRRG